MARGQRSVAAVSRVILGAAAAVLAILGSVYAESENSPSLESWPQIKGQCVSIALDPQLSWGQVRKQLEGQSLWMQQELRPMMLADDEQWIVFFLDTMFRRCQNILDMASVRAKVRVVVLKDMDEFDTIYKKFYDSGFSETHKDGRAFYRYKDNTIYVHRDMLRLGVVAHEMAHGIVDHYFVVLPPVKVQELLAMYVDKEFCA